MYKLSLELQEGCTDLVECAMELHDKHPEIFGEFFGAALIEKVKDIIEESNDENN